VGLAVLITTVRLIRRHPLCYALGGLAGVTIALLAAVLLDRGEGFFLPQSRGQIFILGVSSPR
jgi:hypothetical protein